MSTPTTTPTTLPDCGIYRTTVPIGDVPAGAFVYFHNHGEPGPGVYLPAKWQQNRAEFQQRGHTLPEPYAQWARTLEALPLEGLYRVVKPFHCCEKKCRTFEPDLLVQLGYDGDARAILFVPELHASGFTFPSSGSVVDRPALSNLAALKVAEPASAPKSKSNDGLLH